MIMTDSVVKLLEPSASCAIVSRPFRCGRGRARESPVANHRGRAKQREDQNQTGPGTTEEE